MTPLEQKLDQALTALKAIQVLVENRERIDQQDLFAINSVVKGALREPEPFPMGRWNGGAS